MNRWKRWCSSFKKPVPYDDVLSCEATRHKWLGITWYGWPFPLRWCWFARKVWRWYDDDEVRRILRVAVDEHNPEAPMFCHAHFKGCGCYARLKDAWKWLKNWKDTRRHKETLMKTFVIAIGRNVKGRPMDEAQWALFVADVLLTLSRYGYGQEQVLFRGAGQGHDTDRNTYEDSMIFVMPGHFFLDSEFATDLRKIAHNYGQKEIAIIAGETIMLQADPTEGKNDV